MGVLMDTRFENVIPCKPFNGAAALLLHPASGAPK